MSNVRILLIAGLIFTTSANAESRAPSPLVKSALQDVVVPSIWGDPPTTERVIGQLYYDQSIGGFKGVNKSGGVDTFSISGNSSIISSGSERIERATIQNNGSVSIINQSGDWLSGTGASLVRNSAGNVTITFKTGSFTAAPSCQCTAFDTGGPMFCEQASSASSSAVTIQTFAGPTNSNPNTAKDGSFNITCMGPR